MSELPLLITRLENYTLKHPQEVLQLRATVKEEEDTVVIFKGFSSSLMRPTAFDPEVATLTSEAIIHQIDRLKSPYRPDAPQYLEKGLSLEDFIAKLEALGL
ncbi:MAG: hypothetical protein WBC73_03980 [Phormidesmis sp.]